jgi:hypothetical protein
VVDAFLEAEAEFVSIQRGFADDESADYFVNMFPVEPQAATVSAE